MERQSEMGRQTDRNRYRETREWEMKRHEVEEGNSQEEYLLRPNSKGPQYLVKVGEALTEEAKAALPGCSESSCKSLLGNFLPSVRMCTQPKPISVPLYPPWG